MAAKNDNAIDPGLATLVILLRVHGVDTDADQIRNRYGTKAVSISLMRTALVPYRLRIWSASVSTPCTRSRITRVASPGSIALSFFAAIFQRPIRGPMSRLPYHSTPHLIRE